MTKKRMVVDASVMVKWLRSEKEELFEQADALLYDFQDEKVDLYAPELARHEVGNAFVKRKLLLPDAKSSLATYYNLPVNFVAETNEIAQRSYQIADALQITYYDASYLSLAESLDAVVVTENVKHLGKSTTVTVLPLSKYKRLYSSE